MTGADVVHTDYSLGNVLWDEHGQISGIVDWNFGVARGDRRFALLGMRFHLATEGDQVEGQHLAIDRLDDILAATIEPALLRIYRAHWAVHRVHWSIHNTFSPERIEHDLRFAERHLT
jgi:aminoglycoside phosphotransferase (APT) family kinase protein